MESADKFDSNNIYIVMYRRKACTAERARMYSAMRGAGSCLESFREFQGVPQGPAVFLGAMEGIVYQSNKESENLFSLV